MRRRLALGIALGLLVAVPLAWTLYRQHELLWLLDEPPQLAFRLENARALHDRLLASRTWTSLRHSDAYARFLESPRGSMIETVRHGMTVVLDDDPSELLLRAFGRRVVGALWNRPTGGVASALIALPEDGTDLNDLAVRLRVLSKTQKIRVSDAGGMPTVELGGGDVLALGNGVIALGSSEEVALHVAREWKERLRGDPTGPGLHLEIDPRVAALAEPGPPGGWTDVASLILGGGVAASLRESSQVVATLAPTGSGLRFELRLDAGLDALDERSREIYAPASRAPTPVVRGEILRVELTRDLDALWQDLAARLTPAMLQTLGDVEDELDAPALFRGLFTGLAPGLALHVAPQYADADASEPESPLPGVAISARMRDPERVVPQAARAFDSLVRMANDSSQEVYLPAPVVLDEAEDLGGRESLRARLESAAASGPRAQEATRALTPTIGHRGPTLVLASSAWLARDLVSRDPAAPIENTLRDTLRLDGPHLEAAIRGARDVLLQDRINQGRPPEVVAEEFAALVAVVSAVERLEAEAAYGDTETRVAIELRERPSD